MAINFSVQKEFYEFEQGEHQTFFTHAQFYELVKRGQVIDGRSGGLVVGRSHSEGNIYFLTETYNGFYSILENDHMQGGEYLINAKSTAHFGTTLEQLNNYRVYTDSNIAKINLTKASRVLNTHANPEKFIWLGNRQFIVNHAATAKYFDVLEGINAYFDFI